MKPTRASKSPEMQLIVDAMRKKRDVTFAEVRDAAEAKGLTIYPISYGRAQLMLGIVRKKKKAAAPASVAAVAAPIKRGPGRPRKVDAAPLMPARRGPGRPRKVDSALAIPPRRGPGRPRKNAEVGSGDVLANLNGIVTQMSAMRAALGQIAEIAGRF